jgi:hypothetical protein
MRGQVEKMGATFGGLEAISPNEAARRPIGCRSSRCRPGSAGPGADFNGNRDAHDRQECHHIVVLLRIS